MPNTKVQAVSPTVICANGDFKKLETLILEQIKVNYPALKYGASNVC